MMETIQKLPQLPVEAKIPITIVIVCLAAFFIVVLWFSGPIGGYKVSHHQIKAMLIELDKIEQDKKSGWKKIEPLAERAGVYIKREFPEQAAKIEAARIESVGVEEVAEVLRTQLKIVDDMIQQ